MADQPPQDGADAAGLEQRGTELDVWRAMWRLAFAVFVALLAVCGYWIVSLGFSDATASTRFQYAAVFAFLLGLCVLARWSVPAISGRFDRRSLTLMRSPRTSWFVRKNADDGMR